MKRIGWLVLWAFIARASWGQEARATMGGRVLDPQNVVVPNADVVIRSEDTGVEQSTRTN